MFDNLCYILRDQEHLRKFDRKSAEAIFLGYSTNSKAYRVFNVAINDLVSATIQVEILGVFSDNELETSSHIEIEESQNEHVVRITMYLFTYRKSPSMT